MPSDPPHPPAPAPAPSRRLASIRRSLFDTRPGRLLVGGAVVKLLTWLLRNVAGVQVALIDTVGSLGSVAAVVGVVYFAYRLIVRAKRRLLWRVRRKLILSYVFVGVVPVLLAVAFFAVALLLLSFNVASYLVASDLRSTTDDIRLLARATAAEVSGVDWGNAREILAEERSSIASRFPNASVALVPTPPGFCSDGPAQAPAVPDTLTLPPTHPGRSPVRGAPQAPNKQAAGKARPREVVTVGPWSHLPAPTALPSWVPCSGFEGMLAIAVPDGSGAGTTGDQLGLVIRAAELPTSASPTFAVIVDVPLDAVLAGRIRDKTSVKLGSASLVKTGGDARSPITDAGAGAGLLLNRPGDSGPAKRRFPWFTLVDWRDWETGSVEKAMLAIQVNIRDIYERVSSEQAQLGATSFSSIWLGFLALIAGLFVIIEFVALVMGLVLARSITGSVHELFAGTRRVREGDFSHKIHIRTQDQMGELADSFNQMTASIEDLLRQAEEKKRLEEELRIARSIQMSLLPRGPFVMPGLSVTALCVPAREVGGDYYDLLPLGPGRLGVLIADVSGKGTSAALYMAELKGLMLSLSRIYQSPRHLLIEANRIIASNLDSRSFITMTYAVVDLGQRTITYARAGHTPLMHRIGGGNGAAADVRVLVPDGLVLGLQMDDAGALFERLLQEETIPLRQGDLFMFYTDGISEAMNSESDCFGEARLGEIVAEHGDLPPEELRERILREIDAFVGGAPQHDDMTMILLKVVAQAMAAVAPASAPHV
jgi:serine phosphatase RsbU (regulator of sigma subunit)